MAQIGGDGTGSRWSADPLSHLCFLSPHSFPMSSTQAGVSKVCMVSRAPLPPLVPHQPEDMDVERGPVMKKRRMNSESWREANRMSRCIFLHGALPHVSIPFRSHVVTQCDLLLLVAVTLPACGHLTPSLPPPPPSPTPVNNHALLAWLLSRYSKPRPLLMQPCTDHPEPCHRAGSDPRTARSVYGRSRTVSRCEGTASSSTPAPPT